MKTYNYSTGTVMTKKLEMTWSKFELKGMRDKHYISEEPYDWETVMYGSEAESDGRPSGLGQHRRQCKIPPSIRANKELELRVTKELVKLFPVSRITYEHVKANGNACFSPVMVGQKVMLGWLEEIAPTNIQQGWQTSILRQQLGLAKDKKDKAKQTPETHAHDGIALAASNFMQFKKFHTANTHGHHWVGELTLPSLKAWGFLLHPSSLDTQMQAFKYPRLDTSTSAHGLSDRV